MERCDEKMVEASGGVSDARERAIQAGCLDPAARRVVATYARQRANGQLSADDLEQEAWLQILPTLRRTWDPARASVPRHIAGVAFNAVRTAARDLERRAGIAQTRRLGLLREGDPDFDRLPDEARTPEDALLLSRLADARARLPPELAEEVRRLLVGEASLGRPVRRRAMAALRAALCEHPAREPARRAA